MGRSTVYQMCNKSHPLAVSYRKGFPVRKVHGLTRLAVVSVLAVAALFLAGGGQAFAAGTAASSTRTVVQTADVYWG